MTINAVLRRLVLSSPKPADLAEFYRNAFDYSIGVVGAERRCEGEERSLWIRPGAANQLIESQFSLGDAAALESFARDLAQRGVTLERREGSGVSELSVQDPDGRRVRFWAEDAARTPARASPAAPGLARLQHYALRTPTPSVLVDFYVQRLGFTCSDLVHDDSGDLTAAFLRTDPEHHALAIFRAPQKRFDHFSCETSDWTALRGWADFMAGRSVRLAWGVGRHGPGNDTFFMVLDPDGNLAEISAELEVCAEDRPAGRWRHCMETLNQWGVAIMRS